MVKMTLTGRQLFCSLFKPTGECAVQSENPDHRFRAVTKRFKEAKDIETYMSKLLSLLTAYADSLRAVCASAWKSPTPVIWRFHHTTLLPQFFQCLWLIDLSKPCSSRWIRHWSKPLRDHCWAQNTQFLLKVILTSLSATDIVLKFSLADDLLLAFKSRLSQQSILCSLLHQRMTLFSS